MTRRRARAVFGEAFKHLAEQVNTVEDHHRLHHQSILGGEAKPLPYLLCQ